MKMVHFYLKLSGMNIVLLGYMGSGKSTIGKILAKRLNYTFIDFDAYIEQLEGMTIPQIFEKKGEIHFRKKESVYISRVLEQHENSIVALGGGTPCYGNNMSDILGLAKNVVYLKVSVMGLSKRLMPEKSGRPLIKNIADEDLTEFIGKHLFERSVFYQQATMTIDCDGKDVETIVGEIRKKLV